MFNLPRNIYIVALFMAFCISGSSLMLITGALLSAQLAPDPALTTLPFALATIGCAVSAIPAALIMRRWGRRAGMMLSVVVSILASLTAAWAAINVSFFWLLVAAAGIGFNQAFALAGRFAIMESALSAEQGASGLSLALLAVMLSAIIGPQLAVWGKDLVPAPHGYAGSFLLYVALQLVTLTMLCWFKNPPRDESPSDGSGRSLGLIMRQPIFLIAMSFAALAYSLRSLIVTAAPIEMHELQQYSLESTKWAIQSHIMAMFLPSLVTGWLLTRVLKQYLLLVGLSIYFVACLIALAGTGLPYYWVTLVFLGLGWNLLFLTGTAILPHAYRPEERFKTQACTDFLVVGSEAVASFAAGWLLFSLGWSGMVSIALGITTFALLMLMLSWRHLSAYR